jgi:hypothetical protein
MRRSWVEWLCFPVAVVQRGPVPAAHLRIHKVSGQRCSTRADAANVPSPGGTCDNLSISAHSTPSHADRNMIERTNIQGGACSNNRSRFRQSRVPYTCDIGLSTLGRCGLWNSITFVRRSRRRTIPSSPPPSMPPTKDRLLRNDRLRCRKNGALIKSPVSATRNTFQNQQR